ncbi:MAG: hypothetical protein ABI780_01380 [Ardenticatenales bacterium]
MPGSDDRARWAVSPDGTRLAYARQAAGDNPGLIYVRHLESDAAGPLTSMGPDDLIGALVWSPDSSAVYYDTLRMHEPFPGAMAAATRWELHLLSLDDSGLASYSSPPTVGPLSYGIDAGEDRVLIRLDAKGVAALGAMGAAGLVAVDAAHHRAAVTDGPGESGQVDSIVLFDTTDGREIQRIPGGMEGFRAAANPSGTKLAFTDCLGCNAVDHTYRYRVRVLTLATGEVTDFGEPADVDLGAAILRWSPDDRWLAWKAHGEGIKLVDVAAPSRPAVALDAALGNPVAFTPDGSRLLTSSGELIDPREPATSEESRAVLSWPMPSWLGDWNDVRRVIAWLPAVDRAAAPSPGVVTPPAVASPARSLRPVAKVTAVPKGDDVTASPVLDVAAWSPDSRWLPFWTADGDDHYQYWKWPAALNFVDAATGAVCRVQGVVRTTHADDVFWRADGQVAVRTEGNVAIGRPCDALAPAPDATESLPAAPPGLTPAWAEPPPHEWSDGAGSQASEPSLDGRFIATTTATGDDEDHYVTKITRAEGGAVVAETTWRGNGGLGSMGLGGQWLPDGTFLIAYSVDRGPLRIDPSGDVTDVAGTVFDLPTSISTTADLDTDLYAGAVVDPDSERWHLFLNRAGSVRLYHPESKTVESLPSDELWANGVSADGRLLMIRGRDGEGGSNDGLWIRGIDEAGADFTLMPESRGAEPYNAPLSPDGSRMAFLATEAGRIAVVTFPEGTVVGRWDLGGFDGNSVRWSPDGRTIAVDGYRNSADGGIAERALFIVPLPTEP